MSKKIKSRKRKSIWKSTDIYFVLTYTILTILTLIQIFTVNVIPMKYVVIIAVALFILLWAMYGLQMGKKINKINKILGKILIVILSIFLAFGNWILFKTGSAFSKIAGVNTETSVVSVVVMNDSDYESLTDLNGKTFGTITLGNQEIQEMAIDDITKDVGSTLITKSYSSYKDFGDDLYNGVVDAIILNEGSRGMFEDNHPTFDDDTRVIANYTYTTQTSDLSKDVDVTSEAFNVYITGIDTYGSLATVSRSDVNMIVSVNPQTKQILITGIPRDYYIPQTCQNNQNDKLTHTGIYGVECTLESVENYTGIEINYYARVNFSSVVDIVDALGGITVYSPYSFTTKHGGYYIVQGYNDLNGEQTLGFVRERYSLPNGDVDRNKNQMLVVEAMINKAISPSIITNYGSIMNAISGSFQTNMDESDITSFIKKQINDMSGWDIKQIQLSGTSSSAWSPANGFNSSVMIPNESSVQNAVSLIQKLQAGELITDEDVSYHNSL